ncbi:hypothetical protein D3C86_1376660 [compost metagenome]
MDAGFFSESGNLFAFLRFKIGCMKRSLLVFAIVLTVYSCGNSEKEVPVIERTKSKLEKADWLLGAWVGESGGARMTETWVKYGDNSYKAETYLMFGTDTVFREYSRLNKAGSSLHCIITIPDQNDAKPVVFKLSKQEDDLLVFENHEHDFPQVIVYQHKGDSVIAEISGNQDGKFATERFAMARVK